MSVLVADIQAATARHFGLSLADMLSKTRDIHRTRPRQVAMYVARRLTTRSTSDIARRFGRDHTTVIYACQRIEALRERDRPIADAVTGIMAGLAG